jgi:hypothetical protein
MFMRFRGGGVGHLGTRHLDSRLKVDNQINAIENDTEMEDDHISPVEVNNNDEDEGDADKGNGEQEDADESEGTNSEPEALSGSDDGQDLGDEEKIEEGFDVVDDDEILDEEGYGQL